MLKTVLSLLLLTGLAACQSTHQAVTSMDTLQVTDAVSVFPTALEATAVAAGLPGAVPLLIALEQDLEIIGGQTCDARSVLVRAKNGTVGWVAVTSLKRPGQCPWPS